MVERIGRMQMPYRASEQQVRSGDKMSHVRAAADGMQQDILILQEDWRQTDWTRAVNQVLSSLCDSFPAVTIVTGSVQGEDALRQLAAGLGSGKHLVIDPSFLEKMACGPEEFQKGCATLMRLLRTLQASDITGVYVTGEQAQSWKYFEKSPAAEQMEKARQLLHRFAEMNKPAEQKKPMFPVNLRNYSTKNKYHRLARAVNVSQVHLLISDINGTINSLQGEAISSGGNAAQARRAIRSLRTLLQRATRKISRLQAEQLISAKKKRAEREQKQEEAGRLRQAQKEQRRKRQRADAVTANSGIVQNKRWKYAYDAFSKAEVPACPIPAASADNMGVTEGAADGMVALGPEIAL